MKQLQYIILAAVIGGGVFAYQKFGGKLGIKGAGGGSSGGGGSALSQKLSGYIDCLNGYSNRALDSRQRYLSWADAEKGPSASKNPMGLYTVNDPKPCLEKIAAATDMDPRNAELEKAGTAYSAALAKLAPLLEQADDYYTQKNYQDDKFAKGNELHPKLMAAFNEFDAANTSLREHVGTLNRAERERSVAEREKKGKDLMTHLDRAMLEAESLIELSGPPEEIKVDAFVAQLDKFEKAWNELDAYQAGHKDEQPMMWSQVPSAMKDYLTASKELMRRARDKTPYSSSDKMNLGGSGEWMVNGSPGKMMREYNELIDTVNRL
jgi:Protein of unknown function (DUF3829)